MPADKPPSPTRISIDLLLKVARRTFLHPFAAWMIPLSLRAQATPYHHLSFQISVAYASFITILSLLSVLNTRFAYGRPKPAEHSEDVIVITGGASGLGFLLAEFYAMRGAAVAVVDIKVKPALQESSGIAYYQCDVANAGHVSVTAKRIQSELGTPTVLINNAAAINGKSMLDLTADEAERSFGVNLISHFHTIREFLPGMLENGQGTIVTVASVLGYLGCAKLSDYTAAKAGLIAMHSSLREELRHSENPAADNINTILVAPGQLSTSLFGSVKTPSQFLAPVVEPVELAREIVAMVDSRRSGEIRVPFYAEWIPVLQALPAGLQRVIRSWSGLDRAMLESVQRQKTA